MPTTSSLEQVCVPRKGTVVWSRSYLDYRWSTDHPMSPTRLALTMSLAEQIGILQEAETIAPGICGESELLRVHTRAYVDAVARASTSGEPAQRPGPEFEHGLGSDDNPIFPGMHEAGSVITGGTMAAARAITEGAAVRAVNIGGGMHHAMPDYASGFCVYNDAAVAISWLLDNGYERVAYIDVDVHHGDGVQAAFLNDPRVLTASIHQHPATLWPNTGWSAEVGAGAAEGTAVNIPLLPRTGDALWLRAFHAVIPSVIRAFQPQIIVSQCGVDTHRSDPLADLTLTVEGQRAAFRAMRDLADEVCGGRWLAVGGGGYDVLRVVPRSWTHLLAVALGRDIDPTTPIPVEWQEKVRSLAPDAVLPQTFGDGGSDAFDPWDGPGGSPITGDERQDREVERVDSAILAVRRAVFPVYGLDPDDVRD